MKAEVKGEKGAITAPGQLPTLEELAGSLPPLPEGMEVEDLVRQAKIEHYTESHG